MNHPFKQAAGIIDNLKKHGHDAFFVGGSVRDKLMGRPVGDIDIATSATPNEVQGLFSKVIPVGIEHGTVIVRHQGESYEVTTFRIDGHYTDQRHPDSISFVHSIEDDLRRRDFTINALAMSDHGTIIDPFGGEKDINQKRIRTVGNGQERFSEDALRIIRGIRFSAQLGFVIEQDTLTSMIAMQANIARLAVERIRTEIDKLVRGEFVYMGLSYLAETGVYHYLPVFTDNPEVFKVTSELTSPLNAFSEFIVYCHYHHPAISIMTWIKAWKASNQVKQDAAVLAEALFYYDQYGLDAWLVYMLSLDQQLQSFETLSSLLHDTTVSKKQLQSVRQNLQITSRSELAINGHDLLQLFPEKTPGRWLSLTLDSIERQVVMGQLSNDHHQLKEWVTCHPPDTH